ncbi:hypothetical protein JY651_28765 [Pyxidicoccus parkwayensis]|uniref:Phage tail protein n=1 Tax=Pyxidicoccus parkwayensis TaxID=2813578 RepID=A0ABX7NKP2_9BACT|nr:phage tail tube protein [Pyxidicoccus parkwaysis]QSQ19325.1 hypothetical protein JY651_28765 [Pyxidicoccus parkwaysis]
MSASVAYVQSLHLVATESATAAPTNKLDGISEAPVQFAEDSVDTNYLGSDGWKRNAQTLKSFTIPLSGHVMKGSAPHALLKSSFMTGATVYLLVVEDAAAPTGSQGWRFPVRATSFDEGKSAGDLVTLSCSLSGQGAPVAI